MKTLSLVLLCSFISVSAYASTPEIKICSGLDELSLKQTVQFRDGDISREEVDFTIDLFQRFNCRDILRGVANKAQEKKQTCSRLKKELDQVQYNISKAVMSGSLTGDKWKYVDRREEIANQMESLKCSR